MLISGAKFLSKNGKIFVDSVQEQRYNIDRKKQGGRTDVSKRFFKAFVTGNKDDHI